MNVSSTDAATECYLGIDLGGTRIKTGLVLVHGAQRRESGKSTYTLLNYFETKTLRHRGQDEVIEELIAMARRTLSDSARPVAVGLSCPGFIDPDANTLRRAPLLAGWKDVPLGEIIGSELDLPVHMENDANAAAMSESVWGAGRKASTCVYLAISTGLGVGFVYDQRVWRGHHGVAGELGHVPLFGGGVLCENGHDGCAEAYCTGTAIANRARQRFGKQLSTQDVFVLASQGDVSAQEIVDDAVQVLARFTLILQLTLDPEMAVLGGGLIQGQPHILGAIEAELDRLVEYPVVAPQLAVSALGDQASLLGAVAVCVSQQRRAAK